ncbi:TPA: hypothetical protein NJ500_002129 [Vibrio parahaemolyticus]|nr:hypothetical protein [Vibrio parahaemolyticus]
MINSTCLRHLSLLDDALSLAYRDYFTQSCIAVLSKNINATVNFYSAFIYLTEKENFTGLGVFCNNDTIYHHLKTLIGFIYCNQPCLKSAYRHSNTMKKVFTHIAREKNLTLTPIALSYREVSDEAKVCIQEFKKLSVSSNSVKYLNGWQVQSKEGKTIYLNLDNFYINYGRDFTYRVHKAVADYALTLGTVTLENNLARIKLLFSGFTEICKSEEELIHKLSRINVHAFFQDVMNLLFAQSQARQNDPKRFFMEWDQIVKSYLDCFVLSNVFDAPIKEFIRPNFKTPTSSSPTFSIGGSVSDKEEVRWFSNIPLYIKDEEAIDLISKKLKRDLDHIRTVCHNKFKEIKDRQKRNAEFIKSGRVKPIPTGLPVHEYNNAMGQARLANTVATFYHHGIGAKSDYLVFLGFRGKSNELITELNLPTLSTIQALVTLLVLEHPLITPSWLQNWVLFDKSGNRVGFKQVNSQWVAVSFKRRRGPENAQQTVILNDYSKSIVECLIEHTSFAREHLKRQNNKQWCKVIMTATAIKVHVPKYFRGSTRYKSAFNNWLCDEALLNNGGEYPLSLDDARSLAEMLTIRSVRRHRGLQIYLKTRSMHAVSEALGHKKLEVLLLSSYLPKPLMDFFNARWIRQFQNAILLEAMKGSEYRFDAVDIKTEDIEAFLMNHGISDIPYSLDHGFKVTTNSEKTPLFDEMTFTISTALLQMLIAIRSIVEVEGEDEGDLFKDVVTSWYQSAIFILTSLKHSYRDDEKLMVMLKDAERNPLCTKKIRGALLC